ncbi:MAG: hypothetical protein A2X97_16440 [Bdellovibrionales bacterium GWA1_52_35]|nr:MAG: hypothetical protein A2X97_16440 [Bdellovibrionales bacterium GWA1_52_35]HCM39024.1 hypothetical protein [Bdellovibrionales bacterium]
MKKMILMAVIAMTISMIPPVPAQAGNGSEACVTACTESASASCGEDYSDCWSAHFRGCMAFCWM